MKYKVKKHCTLKYPDGSLRGHAGYIVDSKAPGERATIAEQGDVLDRAERQSVASPVNTALLVAEESKPKAAKAETTKKKTTKKKAAKKKAAKKKASK